MNDKIKCPIVNCNSTFSRQFNLNRHFERFHNNDDLVEKCFKIIFLLVQLVSLNFRFESSNNSFYLWFFQRTSFSQLLWNLLHYWFYVLSLGCFFQHLKYKDLKSWEYWCDLLIWYFYSLILKFSCQLLNIQIPLTLVY